MPSCRRSTPNASPGTGSCGNARWNESGSTTQPRSRPIWTIRSIQAPCGQSTCRSSISDSTLGSHSGGGSSVSNGCAVGAGAQTSLIPRASGDRVAEGVELAGVRQEALLVHEQLSVHELDCEAELARRHERVLHRAEQHLLHRGRVGALARHGDPVGGDELVPLQARFRRGSAPTCAPREGRGECRGLGNADRGDRVRPAEVGPGVAEQVEPGDQVPPLEAGGPDGHGSWPVAARPLIEQLDLVEEDTPLLPAARPHHVEHQLLGPGERAEVAEQRLAAEVEAARRGVAAQVARMHVSFADADRDAVVPGEECEPAGHEAGEPTG